MSNSQFLTFRIIAIILAIGGALHGQEGSAAKKLTSAVETAAKDKSFQPTSELTFCNKFVSKIVKDILGDEEAKVVDGKSANQQFEALEKSKAWKAVAITQDSLSDAHKSANKGTIVLAAYKDPAGGHGHIAVVVPADALEKSGKWGLKLPFIGQAGKTVFPKKKLSYGFSAAKKPKMKLFFYTGKEKPKP